MSGVTTEIVERLLENWQEDVDYHSDEVIDMARTALESVWPEPILTSDEADALLWAIDGLPCQWSGKDPCPYCEKRRKNYETARAKLVKTL
jgi:hypothetical protein